MNWLFKKKTKPMTQDEYQAEYRRLLRELHNQFSIGNSPHELVVNAMGIIGHEMNWNGGCNCHNWTGGFADFLETLREHLLIEKRFTPEQLAKIRWSLDEISACGQELEHQGESSRDATKAVDYLIPRVVDWCQLHPRPADDV